MFFLQLLDLLTDLLLEVLESALETHDLLAVLHHLLGLKEYLVDDRVLNGDSLQLA